MNSPWTIPARMSLCAIAGMGAAFAHAQTAPAPSNASATPGYHQPQVPPQSSQHMNSQLERARDESQHKASKSKYATPQQHEAAAVQEERRKGVGPANPAGAEMTEFQRNALQRCEIFKTTEDRQACVERVRQPQISGSVQGGGVIREYTQTVPVPAGQAAQPGYAAPQPGQAQPVQPQPMQPVQPVQPVQPQGSPYTIQPARPQ